MNVQQTSQLIQLILNTVLMVNACIMMLGILVVRHTAMSHRLQTLNQEYQNGLDQTDGWWNRRLMQLRQQLRWLRQRCWTNSRSILVMQVALCSFVGSTFLLTLRTVINLNGLIPISLWLFVIGVGLLLLGSGLALVDFYVAGRSPDRPIPAQTNRTRDTIAQIPTQPESRRSTRPPSIPELPAGRTHKPDRANNA